MKAIGSHLARADAGDRPAHAAAQHAKGSLTAHERLEVLFDEGSFEDFGAVPGDGVVTGCGTISGRTVFVFAQDVTVRGGSLSALHARQICDVQDRALRAGAPIIGLFDTDGVRLEEGLAALAGTAEIAQRAVRASGVIPQISLILGPCAGAAAFLPALGDFTFMVDGRSHMFAAGPDVVKAVVNETLTPDELGGAGIHTATSGVADGAYANDVEALLQVRRLVDFLPASNAATPPEWPAPQAEEDDASFDTLVPDDPYATYDIKELVTKVADDDDFFEIQAEHAKNIVVGFGRIEGRTVGFVANQPPVRAGVLDSAAARKAARFVRFCDCFAIPLVTFVDAPGFLPGVVEEHGGLIKHDAKLLYAYADASVPKVTVVVRRAFGGAYIVMAPKPLGAHTFAWPDAQIGIMGATGAVAIASDGADAETIAARMKDYEDRCLSPVGAAERGLIDEVIAPRASRRRVAQALAILRGTLHETPWKKHGNIPL